MPVEKRGKAIIVERGFPNTKYGLVTLTESPTNDKADGLPCPGLDWCLFLDFDGTLTGIVEHPQDIAVEARLIDILGALYELLDGAVAVISGRPIAEIDRFLVPLELPAAGKHGLEFRMPDGRRIAPPVPGKALGRIKARLEAAAEEDPRLMVEDKDHTVALHYRQAPERAEDCRRLVRQALAAEDPDLHVLEGKMVLEIKPGDSNKGEAVKTFMAEPVFRDRRPLYAGDDITDEDGFAVVNAMNGVSIRIGDAEKTQALYRMADEAGFLNWLAAARDGLQAAKQNQDGGEGS